ncbi:MAG: DUF4157 domain-containing protein [Candidatus Korobacteraceae bacterium]
MKEHAQRPDPILRSVEPPAKESPKRSIIDAKNATTTDLASADLTNSVNAPRIAGILGELQQSFGNRHVQRMLDKSDSRTFPLEAQSRANIEPALKTDLSDVRLHTGEQAASLADSQQALAVTRGKDVYFAAGEYDPATPRGREILAHELAHVAQQEGAGSHGGAVESEARAAGRSVAAGRPAIIHERADQSALHPIKKEDLAEKTEKPKEDKEVGTPKPPVKPEMAAASFHLTPAIVAAVSIISAAVDYEDRAIEIYAAGDSERPRLLLNLVLLFPAAADEMAKQQPQGIERSAFLQLFGKFLWAEVGKDFVNTIDRRAISDKPFKKKVDRAKGKIETPQPAGESPAK